jgi:hypothetical protein
VGGVIGWQSLTERCGSKVVGQVGEQRDMIVSVSKVLAALIYFKAVEICLDVIVME